MKTIKTVTLNPAFDFHYYMDQFEARRENYVRELRCDAGGKGINISRALTKNGTENTAYTVLGRENCAAFEAQLQQEGLTYVPLYTDGRIRENMTLHPTGDKETRISLDTFQIDLAILNRLEAELSAPDFGEELIAFAGRLPRGVEKAEVIAFLKRQIAIGKRLMIDSNSFTPEDLQEIHPWFIKPNEQEIEAFLGRGVTDVRDAADAAAELVARGVAEEVMISLGGDGAVWSDGDQRIVLSVPRLTHPLSTIGAGDSTLAGFLAGISSGYDTVDALANAVAYGTAACMTEGTQPPRPADIKQILSQVKATRL